MGWQAFGPDGRPTAVKGAQAGVPVWSFIAVISRPDWGVTIFY